MSPKIIPEKLGGKLREIRKFKGLSLDGMAEALGKENSSRRSRVFEWENGIRQPDYHTLLNYAKFVDISTDVLIDDNLELKLPS